MGDGGKYAAATAPSSSNELLGGYLVSNVLGRAKTKEYATMCGRYRLSRRKQIISEHFDAISDF